MKQREWVSIRSRYIPAIWPIVTYWNWDIESFIGVSGNGRTIVSVWDAGNFQAFSEKSFGEELGYAMLDRLYSLSFEELNKIREKGRITLKGVADFCANSSRFLSDKGADVHINFLNEFTGEYHKVMSDNFFYWHLPEHVIQEVLNDELSFVEISDREQIIRTMTKPRESSYSWLIDQELLFLTQTIKENPKIADNMADDIVKKYFWFPYEYVGPKIWTKDDVLDIANKLDNKHGGRIVFDPEEIISEQEKCQKNYSLSDRLQKLFFIMRILAMMQDDRKRYMSETCYYLNGVILPGFGKQIGATLDESRYLDQELMGLSVSDRDACIEYLQSRRKFCVAIVTDYKMVLYEGDDARHKLDELNISNNISESGNSVVEIKGTVAHSGFIRGRVKILNMAQGIEFNDGDILVTGMTTPDFVPLMRRSSAVITNEGGITCHAAIIARELKKPCIIGTKIATQVLKDGDIVEVDADKGVVRILERTK